MPAVTILQKRGNNFSLSPCMDWVHSGQVCGDMVDSRQFPLAVYEPYALACEKSP